MTTPSGDQPPFDPPYGNQPPWEQPAYEQPPAYDPPAYGQAPMPPPAGAGPIGYGYPPPPPAGYGQPFPPPGYPPMPGGYYPAPPHPQSMTALILGIVGLLCCALASPFAIWLGSKSMKEIDASGGQLSGRGQAQAGFILGIVGAVIWVLGIAFYVAMFGLAVSSRNPMP